MTFENSKRLYEHYMKIGRIAEANELAAKRPEIVESAKEEKSKKSK